MFDFFSPEIVNKGRQKELDLAKGVAIILMVFCHVGIYFFEDGTRYMTLSDLIGCEYAAPVFMVCLGVGTVYSKHNSAKDLAKRGLVTLFFGYLLNFVRETLPAIFGAVTGYTYTIRTILLTFALIDIMQFAGMAFLTLALFKTLKLNCVQQFMLGLLAAGAGEVLAWHSMGSEFLDGIFGLIWGTYDNSYFPLLNWLVFPTAGVMFGELLQHTSDKTKLYKSIFFIGLIGTLLTFYQKVNIADYYNNHSYYFMGIKNVIFALCYPIVLFSVCQFVADKTELEDLPIVGFCSKYLNTIYCISWVIILWSRYIIYDILNIELSIMTINLMMPATLIVSYLLAKLYVAFKAKKK